MVEEELEECEVTVRLVGTLCRFETDGVWPLDKPNALGGYTTGLGLRKFIALTSIGPRIDPP